MVTNYFTFGVGHTHTAIIGEYMGRRAIKITGATNAVCRETMYKMYGVKWSFQYSEKDFEKSEFFKTYEIYLDITLNTI